MKYIKKAKTFEEQADLLLSRGMDAERDMLIARLSEVNYYRLSAYWYTFRDSDSDCDRLKPGTSFNLIWDRYVFDRQLRVLAMDAIERVEVAIRTRLTNAFTLAHGAFGYIDRTSFNHIKLRDHWDLQSKFRMETLRSKETFVKHFHETYTSETDLPLWMACELMSFGTLLTLFKNVDTAVKQEIAETYGISDKVLENWMMALNEVRNICAHHARLWNKNLGTSLTIPRANKHPDWHVPFSPDPKSIYAVLTILRYLLKQVAPQSRWHERLRHLIETKHPGIPIAQMGFPADWKSCPIWQEGERP